MLNKHPDRVILDTNIWISFLITKNFKKFDSLLKDKKVVLLFSNELMLEFIEVAARPKFKKYFNQSDLKKILSLLDQTGEMINVRSKISVCRDPKDNFLLSLAMDGHADYLITGDLDLLQLKSIGKTKIITAANYLIKKHI